MVIVALFAALALAAGGHPATVTCDPSIVGHAEGQTSWDTSGVHVQLSPLTCVGLLLYRATPGWRRAFQSDNPQIRVDADALIGIGLEVAAHEAAHAAGTVGETDAQCAALDTLRRLGLTDEQMRYALAYDQTLPPVYHQHPCEAP